jgi:serine/threonine protein phosphatase PrpC
MRALTTALSKAGGRRYNEDAYAYWQSPSVGCWVVCDGAGGHEGGAVASQLASSKILELFKATPAFAASHLHDMLCAANDAVVKERHAARRYPNMRTTGSVLLIDLGQARALWGYAGDTRVYFFRRGRVLAHTRDHSVVQTLVDGGMLQQDELRSHPRRSALLTALGEDSGFTPSVLSKQLPVEPGDAFLICTDGLWEYVLEAEMEQSLTAAGSPDEWARALERLLLSRAPKDHDNYSLLGVWLAAEKTAVAGTDDDITVLRV